MRAPGEMPGMFAHEVAMDELAVACGVDPIELRERNEPDVDPETGKPFNNRRLVDCLRRGAERFGWADRPAEPRATARRRLVGRHRRRVGDVPGHADARQRRPRSARSTAAATPSRSARVDIGTGARTVLTQIAADALGVGLDAIELAIARHPPARRPRSPAARRAPAPGAPRSSPPPSGSAPTTATAPTRASRPPPRPRDDPDAERYAFHSFGAVFAEARVHRLDRRGPGPAAARRLLGRPGHQPDDRPLAVPRRPGDGPVGRRCSRSPSATRASATS